MKMENVLYATSYFIDHHRHRFHDQARILRFDEDASEWENDVRFIWEDHVDPAVEVDVILVRPTPPFFAFSGTMATVIVQQRPQPDRAACLLTAILPLSPDFRLIVTAHSMELTATQTDVIRLAGVEQQCVHRVQNGFGPCILQIGLQRLDPMFPIPITTGLGITIRVPPPMSEEEAEHNVDLRYRRPQDIPERVAPGEAEAEPEDTSLMARQPRPQDRQQRSSTGSSTSSSSTSESSCRAEGSDVDPPDTRRAVVFPLHGMPQSLILPWNDGEALFRRVAEAFDLAPSDVRDLHYMPHRPTDLALQNLQGLLLQRLFEPRPSTFLRLVLIDVETYEDNLLQPSAFQRYSKWLPHTLNRQSVLRLLDLEHIVAQYAAQTKLWLNHCLIEENHPEVLQLHDGDYVKVFIGDSNCENLCLSDVELPDIDLDSDPHGNNDWYALRDDQMSLMQQFTTFAGVLRLLPTRDLRTAQHCKVDAWQETQADTYGLTADEQPGRHTDMPQGHRGQMQRDDSIQHLWMHSPAASTMEDAGRVVPFDTWFLNGQDHPRCDVPRKVELTSDRTTWDDLVIQAWQDLFDVCFTYRIVLVRPTSEPCQHAGHLLLLQRESPGERGLLVSLFWHEETSKFDGRFARLLPRRLAFQRLLRYARLDRLCNDQQLLCLGYQGHDHLDGISDVTPQTGNHFEIHAAPWEYLDSLNLLQNNITMQSAQRHALEAEPPEAGYDRSSCATSQAITHRTSTPPLAMQSGFVRELFALWHHGAFAWGQEERSARVVTYYVNHHDLFPRCDAGRPVHLWANYATWEEAMRRTWMDRIRPGQPLDFFVVVPMPPHLEPGIVAYVLLIQNCRDLVTSLVSVIGTNGRLQGRSAVTTFAQVYDVHFVQALGLHQQCLGPQPILTCEMRFQDQPLLQGRPFVTRNGYSFAAYLHINHRQRAAIGRNLIQSHTQLTRSRVGVRSTTEEPLLSTVLSPVLCAIPPLVERAQQEPMDFAPEHIGTEPRPLQQPVDPQTPIERAPLPNWLPPWWDTLLRQWQDEGDTECLEEGPILYVLTWFLHGQHHRQCSAPRVLRLDQYWHRWWEDLKLLWQDMLDASLPAAVGIVHPTPPLAPTRYHSAHIIIHQATMAESACVVTQLYHGQWHNAFGQLATVLRPMIDANELIHQMQISHICVQEGRGCVVQYRDRFLHPADPPFFIPDYASVVMHIDHPAFGPRHGPPSPGQGSNDVEEDENSNLHLPCERPTDRLVAHTCRPQRLVHPQILSLDELLPVSTYQIASDCDSTYDPLSQMSTVIAYLTPGHDDLCLPPYIEVYPPSTVEQVELELVSWGHLCKAIQFGGHEQFVCFSTNWVPADHEIHYVYGSEQGQDVDLAFLHTSTTGLMTVKDHMCLLYKRGCMKVAITEDALVWRTMSKVTYICNQPELPVPDVVRTMTPWPSRQPCVDSASKPFQKNAIASDHSTCHLTLGCTMEELDTMLHSGKDVLCTELTSLAIPDTTAIALRSCTNIDRVDRLVIFTDGSSVGNLRHQPPQLTDEQGCPDSWAFVVLAEQYLEDGGSAIQFLGWQAQPVRYDPDSPAFLGTCHTGSDAAEREAMFWASFWRLTTNSFVPTVFCSDSKVTCLQATGCMGTSAYDETFRCLRGVHQALEAFMPTDTLKVQHVHGHANDPWNDLADFLAKQVRTEGYYLPRQQVSLASWKPLIPFLWMLFSQNSGLPKLTAKGFDVTAPALPSEQPDLDEEPLPLKQSTIKFTLSLASANVQSLLSKTDHGMGHAGKIQYAREQFKAHGLQILGIQEARTPQLCGTQDEVLRISSGHQKGHYGVELWIDLDRPYAYVDGRSVHFAKHHFTVLHAEPRLLIVRAHADYLHAVFVVAHAPHSGYTRADREAWWRLYSLIN